MLVALRLLYAEAHFTRAQVRGEAIVFPPSVGLRLVAGIGIVGLIVAIIMSKGREESWVYGLAVGLWVLLCFGLPSTITIKTDGVGQETWWGRKTVIGWADVSGLEKRRGENSTSLDGTGNPLASAVIT